MEEEKEIEDGNNEIDVEQNAPVEQPVAETPVVEPVAPVEPVAEPQPVEDPTVEPTPVAETPAPVEQKKKSKIPLILLIIILLAACGFAFGYFVLGGNGAKKEQKEEQKQEEKKEEEKKEEDNTESTGELTNPEIIKQLETTINAVKYNGCLFNLVYDLYDGKDGLSKEEKIQIIYNNIDLNIEAEAPDKYKDDGENNKDWETKEVKSLKLDDFDKQYKNIFIDDPDYTEEDFYNVFKYDDNANLIMHFDKELGKIFFYPNYGCGATAVKPKIEIKKYTKEKDEYNVYVEFTRYDNLSDGQQPEPKTVVWNFDKDCRFLSTKVVEE